MCLLLLNYHANGNTLHALLQAVSCVQIRQDRDDGAAAEENL